MLCVYVCDVVFWVEVFETYDLTTEGMRDWRFECGRTGGNHNLFVLSTL